MPISGFPPPPPYLSQIESKTPRLVSLKRGTARRLARKRGSRPSCSDKEEICLADPETLALPTKEVEERENRERFYLPFSHEL
jgi:hypothetical protein